MARTIRWTSRADRIFTEILEFYYRRSKSKSYSRKLNREIDEVLELIKIYPFLGMSSNVPDTRVFISGHFKIFYEVKPDEIVVQLVWDTRQEPEKFPLT